MASAMTDSGIPPLTGEPSDERLIELGAGTLLLLPPFAFMLFAWARAEMRASKDEG